MTTHYDYQFGYRSPEGQLSSEDQLSQELQAQAEEHAAGSTPTPDYDAVKVEVENAGSTSAVQTGVYQTVVIPPSSAAVCSTGQLLGRDIKRQYARFMAIDGPIVIATAEQMAQSSANIGTATGQSSPASSESTGSQGSPVGSNANISGSPAIGPGTWVLSWQVGISGTVSSTDINNMGIYNSAGPTLIVKSMNPGAVGNYPQTPITVTVPAGGSVTYTVLSVAAATVGATYYAQLVATPVGTGGVSVPVPQGIYLPALILSDVVHHNEAVWAANPSTTAACRVSVYLERGF